MQASILLRLKLVSGSLLLIKLASRLASCSAFKKASLVPPSTVPAELPIGTSCVCPSHCFCAFCKATAKNGDIGLFNGMIV